MKHKLRAEIAQAVKDLSPDYCREADRAICEAVLASPQYASARTVFCYAGTQREINTTPLLEAALADGKVLALPLCTREPGVMEARVIRSLDDLVSGKYGILAPGPQCPVLAPQDLDLAIVPCSSGNRRGQRLGYGGGYYDRYLARTGCPKMLLCRERLCRDNIPTDEHDLTMDFLVTEAGVFSCKD